MAFHAARLLGRSTPPTRERPLAAGISGRRGHLLLVDGSGNYANCGADPAAIAAVALSDYGADTSGLTHTGKKEFPPGYMQAISVQDNQPFLAHYMGALPAAAGATYGVTLDADGEWKVDFTKSAANQRVKLTNLNPTVSPINRNQVEVVFLVANVQINQ